ncbi:hypothetical protein L211DRAFT_848575 [Terfezia boudieri ATCC MYA-4762]|uniref:Transcriptional regulatory protein DEP1 n=1 Tax=Terfezia boudieri ATCC MYA-4762 TaxID=1051890 RepID=A0A3N4LPC4_9PEZI|nr:hypothetical protein L211DRAFT_848575 [Terfezia boudieri ATCC MYA-4762]
MRSVPKRGRRSRPSSLALEEQQEAPLPLKRTRSAHSSPAVAQPTRPTQSYQVRRQDHNPRPQSSNSGGHSSRNSHTNDTSNHKEPSPIPEVPFDDDLVPQMPPDSKVATATRVETVKRRGSRDSKRPAAPAPLPKLPDLIDDPHVSDMSSLSELDSEAETERLEDSPRKGGPRPVYSYLQPPIKPIPPKVPMEPKQNKSPDVDMTLDEGESQPAKKRKRENNDVAQKDVKVEEKTSRPVTPLASKILAPLDKSKRSKTADPIQEKQGAMEGIEAAALTVIVNGDENLTQEDHPEPEPDAAPENFAETDERKDPPQQDVDPEADEDTAEGAEVSREDEEDAERLQKRKAAADALTQIELEFAKLRDKLYEERISDIDEEIRLVNEGTHPELVTMMEAVNKRRDDKIRLYNTQLRYALHSQHTTMTATRSQLHSQYAQHVREIRERYLDRVSEGLYQIQRERRATDMLVQDYTYRISEDRATRMRERQAYNMEVQILSGIAKYIGFPAAPEVKGVAANEMQQDLEAMGSQGYRCEEQNRTAVTTTKHFANTPSSPSSQSPTFTSSPHVSPRTASVAEMPSRINANSKSSYAYVTGHFTGSLPRLWTHKNGTGSTFSPELTSSINDPCQQVTIASIPTTITAASAYTPVTAPAPTFASRIWPS